MTMKIKQNTNTVEKKSYTVMLCRKGKKQALCRVEIYFVYLFI